MAPSSLHRLTLAGMVALLVGGAACAETPDATQDDVIEAVRTRANAGDADAQYNLADRYYSGEGIPRDMFEAVAWYRKAAEQGQGHAQLILGLMYRIGKGVPEDAIEAAAWLRKAAEQGGASAMWNLGMMDLEGRGVPQDFVEAYKWFNLATTYTDTVMRPAYALARDNADQLLTPEQLAEGQRLAREWFAAHPPE